MYSNVKPDAEPAKLAAVGTALSGLFDNEITGLTLCWFLLVRMENKLAGLTVVIGELSCNIASLRGEPIKKI